MTAFEKLKATPVVPLIQAKDTGIAVETVNALISGGLSTIEVVLRTPESADCLEKIAQSCPQAFVGAGTVLTLDQAKDSIARGAQFIVCPGLDDQIVTYCQNNSVPVFPGTMTASEIQHAWNLGLKAVKFFPASLAGGTPMLKAFSSVFQGMHFMPTGGINTGNLQEYLSLPKVLACGGSWLTPAAEIEAGNFAALTTLAQEALAIAEKTK